MCIYGSVLKSRPALTGWNAGRLVSRVESHDDRALRACVAAWISVGTFPRVHASSLGCERFVAWGASAVVNSAMIADRRIAVKQYRLTRDPYELAIVRKRFRREAAILYSLDHPNVVGFVGILDDPNRMCIMMPWMHNGELNGFLKRNPDALRIPLAYQIAVALEYLKGQYIVHGDLKGANVLIDREGNARIADFGSAYILAGVNNSLASHEFRYLPLSTGGTYRWMAPELLAPNQFGRNASQATFESDVFAFGMVVYEILTGGNIPFHEKPSMAANLAILAGERPLRPPNTSDNLWALANECWKQDPGTRPDFKSMVIALNT
ncbi:kinase-like domain-containing protein [Mycena capillaripes]|nr:kinase-like domain-containing protein [Mycena capillaripes]